MSIGPCLHVGARRLGDPADGRWWWWWAWQREFLGLKVLKGPHPQRIFLIQAHWPRLRFGFCREFWLGVSVIFSPPSKEALNKSICLYKCLWGNLYFRGSQFPCGRSCLGDQHRSPWSDSWKTPISHHAHHLCSHSPRASLINQWYLVHKIRDN